MGLVVEVIPIFSELNLIIYICCLNLSNHSYVPECFGPHSCKYLIFISDLTGQRYKLFIPSCEIGVVAIWKYWQWEFRANFLNASSN